MSLDCRRLRVDRSGHDCRCWIASGHGWPTWIYYGLTLLTPSIFLAAAIDLCAVGVAIVGDQLGHGRDHRSWALNGAFVRALVIPAYWTAGAVAYRAHSLAIKVSPGCPIRREPCPMQVNGHERLSSHIKKNAAHHCAWPMIIRVVIYIWSASC